MLRGRRRPGYGRPYNPQGVSSVAATIQTRDLRIADLSGHTKGGAQCGCAASHPSMTAACPDGRLALTSDSAASAQTLVEKDRAQTKMNCREFISAVARSPSGAPPPVVAAATLMAETKLLRHCRTLFGIEWCSQRMIARQFPAAQIFGDLHSVPGSKMPPQRLAPETAFQADDVVMLHRSLDRDCRRPHRRRLRWHSQMTNRVIDRGDQFRQLIR